jgi:hypothetical protein
MMQSPQDRLVEMVDLLRRPMLGAVTELGIPDLLAAGPRGADELAAATGTRPEPLLRVLRALATYGVFKLRPDGRFELTEVSELLRKDRPGSMHYLVLFRSAPWFAQGPAHLLHTLRTGEPGFVAAHGMSFFEYAATNAEAGALFNAFMRSGSNAGVEDDRHVAVAESFDFSPFRSFVDVGGGTGGLLRAVLDRHPHMSGVLFDTAVVLKEAEGACARNGAERRYRVEAGDFFEYAPAGGDLYALSFILHDWPDEKALRILRNVRAGIVSDGRVLVIERLLPAWGEDADLLRHQLYQDVNMMVNFGGRERSAEDYRLLLKDAGFELVRVVPTGSAVSIVEAKPVTQ